MIGSAIGAKAESETQIVRDRHTARLGRIIKCPNHMHSFRQRLQMKKTDFKPFAVDDLLGSPRDRNAGTPRGHHDDVAIGPRSRK